MNDKPNPAPRPTVEEMLIAIFRLLVVIAIAAVITAALLIMAAYGTPHPPDPHTSTSSAASPGRCGNQPGREKRDWGSTWYEGLQRQLTRDFVLSLPPPGVPRSVRDRKQRNGPRRRGAKCLPRPPRASALLGGETPHPLAWKGPTRSSQARAAQAEQNHQVTARTRSGRISMATLRPLMSCQAERLSAGSRHAEPQDVAPDVDQPHRGCANISENGPTSPLCQARRPPAPRKMAAARRTGKPRDTDAR